jgi:hypothetical protein
LPAQRGRRYVAGQDLCSSEWRSDQWSHRWGVDRRVAGIPSKQLSVEFSRSEIWLDWKALPLFNFSVSRGFTKA